MLLQPITVPFSKSTLKPSVYTLISAKNNRWRIVQGAILIAGEQTGDDKSRRYERGR